MAAPSRFRRLEVSDYVDAPGWLSPFVGVLNEALESVASALSGRLTRVENMRGGVKQLDVSTLNPVANTFPIRFKPPDGIVPTDCWIGKVELAQGTVQPTAASLIWKLESDGTVRIDSIAGLSASQRYRVRVIFEAN